MHARILALIPLLASSLLCAQSQYAKFTATNIEDAAGNKLLSGTITFVPVNMAGAAIAPQVNGGGRIVPRPIVFTVVSGVPTASYGTTRLVDVTQASPANFCYLTSVHDNDSGETWTLDPCLQPAYNASWCSVASGVTTCNYDNYAPALTPGVPVMAPTLSGGAFTTGAPGSSVACTVSLLNYAPNYQMNCSIPRGYQGIQGLQGQAALMGTERGAYSATTTYAVSDVVAYSGQSYASLLANNIGNEPDTSIGKWGMLANLSNLPQAFAAQSAATPQPGTFSTAALSQSDTTTSSNDTLLTAKSVGNINGLPSGAYGLIGTWKGNQPIDSSFIDVFPIGYNTWKSIFGCEDFASSSGSCLYVGRADTSGNSQNVTFLSEETGSVLGLGTLNSANRHLQWQNHVDQSGGIILRSGLTADQSSELQFASLNGVLQWETRWLPNGALGSEYNIRDALNGNDVLDAYTLGSTNLYGHNGLNLTATSGLAQLSGDTVNLASTKGAINLIPEPTNDLNLHGGSTSGSVWLNAYGTGKIRFNDKVGASTNGILFYSGGATPTIVASVDGAGNAGFYGLTSTYPDGITSPNCIATPNTIQTPCVAYVGTYKTLGTC
jgi:hypothetical protein